MPGTRAESLTLGERVEVFDRIGFSKPAAIIYDAGRDLYWVSNASGLGRGGQGKGFISRLDPEGRIATLNFIDGNRPDIALQSPQGLAVDGNTLFVADGSAILRFDAESGAALGILHIEGASHLSDVAIGPGGDLYATDVGSEPALAVISDAGTDAVYRISGDDAVSVVARRPNLGGPYALLANESGLWMTCTGSNDLLLLVPREGDTTTRESGRLGLPGRAPRGLVQMPDGSFLISSWESGTLFRGYRDGPFQPVIEGLETPVDLGYDSRRQRVLIPLSSGHAVAIFQLVNASVDPLRGAAARPSHSIPFAQ